ncbi:MAG: ATP-binding protein [Chloroflexi bacterium]|nr:ATP-binding protein [Chloroflexota bacterium]
MTTHSVELYESIRNFSDIEHLIQEGESESQHLEAKAPTHPTLTRDQKKYISKAVSGFSNSGGGVIVWGVSTIKHSHGNIDILSQIEPIANCKSFSNQIAKYIPLSTEPSILNFEIKTIKQNPGDKRGIIITLIPDAESDPIRTSDNKNFYLRVGDEFGDIPYEILRRMFFGSRSPDLIPNIDERSIKMGDQGFWELMVGVDNNSTVVAEKVKIIINFLNSQGQAVIIRDHRRFQDISDINPESNIYSSHYTDGIHKGFGLNFGNFRIKMNGRFQVLNMDISLFSSNMRATFYHYKLKFRKNTSEIVLVDQHFLY